MILGPLLEKMINIMKKPCKERLNTVCKRTGDTCTVDEASLLACGGEHLNIRGARNLVVIPTTMTPYYRGHPISSPQPIYRKSCGDVLRRITSGLESLSISLSLLEELSHGDSIRGIESVSLSGCRDHNHLDFRMASKVFPEVKHLTVKNLFLCPWMTTDHLNLESLTVEHDTPVETFSHSLFSFEFFSRKCLEKNEGFRFEWKRGDTSYGLDELEKILGELSGLESLEISSAQIRSLEGKNFSGLVDEICIISPMEGDVETASRVFGINSVYTRTESDILAMV